MFERFTAEARKALFAARRVAEDRGLAEIAPEHLLAGVLAVDPECIGSERTAAVLGHLEPIRFAGRRSEPVPEFIPFSTSTKQCLVTASDRAAQLGHRGVRSEHLVAALLVNSSTDAAKALTSAGVTARTLEASALSRSATDTEPISPGPTLHTFVVPFREQ